MFKPEFIHIFLKKVCEYKQIHKVYTFTVKHHCKHVLILL